jgi:hypothetical protein
VYIYLQFAEQLHILAEARCHDRDLNKGDIRNLCRSCTIIPKVSSGAKWLVDIHLQVAGQSHLPATGGLHHRDLNAGNIGCLLCSHRVKSSWKSHREPSRW